MRKLLVGIVCLSLCFTLALKANNNNCVQSDRVLQKIALPRIIIANGKTNYQITYSDTDPQYALKFTAEELQHFLKEITGVEVPITLSPDPDKLKFSLIQSSGPPKGYSSVRMMPSGDILIVGNNYSPHGNSVSHITSGVPCYWGTLYGVYDFLRSQGCGWYWAGEWGEVIPKKETVEVNTDFVIESTPNFVYFCPDRGPRANNGDWYRGIWAIRNGGCNIPGIYHDHSWYRYMNILGKTTGINSWARDCEGLEYPDEDGYPTRCGHPEYFAMVYSEAEGKYPYDLTMIGKSWANHLDFYGIAPYDPMANRVSHVYKYDSCGQVCTSNTGTVQVFADYARWYFSEDKRRSMISLSPNDGMGFCECLECQKLDGSIDRSTLYGDMDGDGDVDQTDVGLWQVSEYKNQIDINKFTFTGTKTWDDALISPEENQFHYKKRHLTDRIMKFYRDVANAVPEEQFCGYAYEYYSHLPRREMPLPPPNLNLCLVYNDLWYVQNGYTETRSIEKTEYWGNYNPGKMYASDIGCWKTFGCTQPLGDSIINRIKIMNDNNFKGWSLNLGGSWENFGIDSYLFVRLSYDPTLNVEELTKDYYKRLYKDAYPHVQQFYDTITADRMKFQGIWNAPNPDPYKGIHPNLALIAYSHRNNELNGFIEASLDHIDPADIKLNKRLERLASHWRMTKGTVQAINAGIDLHRQPATPELWKKYKDGVDARRSELQEWLKSDYGREAYAQATYDELLINTDLFKTISPLYTLPMDKVEPKIIYENTMDEYDTIEPIKMWVNGNVEIVDQGNGNKCIQMTTNEENVEPNSHVGGFFFEFTKLFESDPGERWLQLLVDVKIENPGIETQAGSTFSLYNSIKQDDGVQTEDKEFMYCKKSDFGDWVTVGEWVKVSWTDKDVKFKWSVKTSGKVFFDNVRIYEYKPPVPNSSISEWYTIKKQSFTIDETTSMYDISIALDSNEPVSESRSGGIETIRANFTDTVTITGNATVVSDDGTIIVPSNQELILGKSLYLSFDPPLENEHCYTIDISTAVYGLGHGVDTDVQIRGLTGDVNNDGYINSMDVGAIESELGVDVSKYWRYDINRDGKIDITDVDIVRNLVGTNAVCPD